jgi:ribonucleoside-diphosphate reductase alpha chain
MDKFIDAVKNDKEIELSWKGKYKSSIKAKELWSIICKNAYNSAEPGILNLDLANSENTIYYIEDLVTTNPCGELFLTEFESCCLTSLVLPRFVTEGSLDYAMLGESIRTAVRFLDNVHTVNHYPLPEMKTKAQKLRRIGLGVTGLADMLVLMDFKYGSSESNLFVDRLFEFITKTAYESSILLAIEKGAFEGFNPEKHIQSGFVKRLSNRLKSLILEHGIRNSAIISIPPTGTVSILSGNCSSGIEPMFAPAYYRNYFENDVRKRELVFHPLFKRFIEEGRDVDCFVGGSEISVEQHMEVQKIIQKHVDNAVSKTIIMKQDYSIEDMSKVWLKYLPFLKGVTFYRENSRKFIDKNGLEQEPPLVALTVEEALNLINEEHTEKTLEQKCKSGTCEL